MHRRIYTRTGDNGETGLMAGLRVAKDSDIIEAVGAIDELNAVIGLALLLITDADCQTVMIEAQNTLFAVGAGLATPRQADTDLAAEIANLESAIDALDDALPPLRRFILPGGSESAARIHWARAVCRRTERCLVRMHRTTPVAAGSLVFVNRLSDYLFTLARAENHRQQIADPEWSPRTDPK